VLYSAAPDGFGGGHVGHWRSWLSRAGDVRVRSLVGFIDAPASFRAEPGGNR
jgi:hypothetical protein